MANTVIAAMSNFLTAIQPTSSQTGDISTSHTALRSYLRSQLQVEADFLTGSYVRDTMIRQSRDVDMFIVLDNSYWAGSWSSPGYRDQANGPSNCLNRIRNLLTQRYGQSEIHPDRQAVTVEFTHVHLDVVPAFSRWRGYIIANPPQNNWIESDPTQQAEAVSNLNAYHAGRFVPLVKMLKYWNYSHNSVLRGFFLEMWALDVFRHRSLSSYAEGIYNFFDSAINYIDSRYSVPDPGSNTDLMQRYLSSETRRVTTRSRFVTARDLATRAIQANTNGDNYTAIITWKRLFGDAYPNYG